MIARPWADSHSATSDRAAFCRLRLWHFLLDYIVLVVYNGWRLKVDGTMWPCTSSMLTPALIASHHPNTRKSAGHWTARATAWPRINRLRDGWQPEAGEGKSEKWQESVGRVVSQFDVEAALRRHVAR